MAKTNGGGNSKTNSGGDKASISALEMSFALDQIVQLSTIDPAMSLSDRSQQFTKLHRALGNLVALQVKIPKSCAHSGINDFGGLLGWLAGHGVDHSKVEIASYGDQGNGIKAVSKLQHKDSVLKIPTKCMFAVETLDPKSSLAKFIDNDTLLSAMPNVALAVYLLSEMSKGPGSSWDAYLQTLPKSYSVPLFYSLDDFSTLKGSPVYEQATSIFRSVARQYVYVYKRLKEPDAQKALGLTPSSFSFEDFRWAVACVMTRQNRIPIKLKPDNQPVFALTLIPLWDMINHATGEVTSHHDPVEGYTEYAAMKTFAPGEQVFMFYGPRPNSELLVHSGFVIDGNTDDYMTIKLGVGKGDKLKNLKEKLLNALSIPTSGDFTISSSGEPDPQLNAFIRINSMTEEELNSHLSNPQSCATLGNADGAVNPDNEAKACLFFETRCKLLLRSYGSDSIEDDTALLNDPQLTYPKRCALTLRRMEKRALLAAAETVALRGLDEEL